MASASIIIVDNRSLVCLQWEDYHWFRFEEHPHAAAVRFKEMDCKRWSCDKFIFPWFKCEATAAWTFRNQFAGISIPLIRSAVAGCGRVRSRSEKTRSLVFFTAVLEGDDWWSSWYQYLWSVIFWHSPFNVLFVKIWDLLSNELFYLVSRLRCVFVSLYTIINYEEPIIRTE